ncbi:hypothetical protein Ciccas_000169 [Cichlidogyrus casuarinus]|uniref:Uncharacterized protein n=1 Tax=Cichlidogyrus casuarinus TaxID=1844966 RepID=A0ABD2QNN2_9PLAT
MRLYLLARPRLYSSGAAPSASAVTIPISATVDFNNTMVSPPVTANLVVDPTLTVSSSPKSPTDSVHILFDTVPSTAAIGVEQIVTFSITFPTTGLYKFDNFLITANATPRSGNDVSSISFSGLSITSSSSDLGLSPSDFTPLVFQKILNNGQNTSVTTQLRNVVNVGIYNLMPKDTRPSSVRGEVRFFVSDSQLASNGSVVGLSLDVTLGPYVASRSLSLVLLAPPGNAPLLHNQLVSNASVPLSV